VILRTAEDRALAKADAHEPCPFSWQKQTWWLKALPAKLANVTLLAGNTGRRDAEICNLRWEWDAVVPEMGAAVFVTPGSRLECRDVGLQHLHAHHLKHTFGRLLRAVEVSIQDRRDLLGHPSHRLATHCASPC
jgi:integrase